MEKTLRILHLEDDSNDIELVQATMSSNGLRCRIEDVCTREQFRSVLERGGLDLILSDYSLPSFDGLSALQIAQEIAPGVPFILVSGAIGEEMAIETMKRGATDYVLKSHLSRLAPAVRRALQEAEERKERLRAEEALRVSEEQLRQAQKMEAIGQLAGGVAHDFNNLLNVIMGYGELSLLRLEADHPVRSKLEQITKAAERAASLTRQLLAFSRKQVLEPRVLDLNSLLPELDKMLRRLIGEDIELVTLLGADLGRVKADPGQVEQIVMNLVVNARDAMPQGGRLTLETVNVFLDEEFAEQHPGARLGAYVMLAVRDTGIGMSPEVRARIFEPFFTTKELGKGTGLGLATVYGIVKQSGGYIWVSSEHGSGATFNIYLPQVDEPVQAAASPEAAASPRGTETVLVVEDENAVRELVGESLRGYGYAVLEAANLGQAAEITRRHQGRIHLLITDVVLPGTSGLELASRLSLLRPGLKVLYVSGYTDDNLVRHGVLEAGGAFLQKPFALTTLARKVREVLVAGTELASLGHEEPDRLRA